MSVLWMPQALASLATIAEYIAAQDPVAAHALIDDLEASVEDTLAHHPFAGRPGRVDGTREWVAHRNYVVAYRVTDARDVEILNVIHSAQLWPDAF